MSDHAFVLACNPGYGLKNLILEILEITGLVGLDSLTDWCLSDKTIIS